MAIVNRSKDTWQIRIYLGRDKDGKVQQLNETFKGKKKDAEAFEAMRLRELKQGILVESSNTILNEYLNKWLETAAKRKLRERTYEDYTDNLRRYVRPIIGKRQLSKIRPLDVQQIYTQMLQRGLSARTVRCTHSILSSALNQAVKWQLLPYNPAKRVDLPQNQRNEMKAFTAEEARLFLNTAKKDKWYAIFSLALSSGMRPEEYLGLQWKNVDFDNGKVVVERVIVWRRKGGGWTLQEPKTPQSRRSIPLPASVTMELKAHKTRQLEERFALGSAYENNDFVFATEIGTPIQASNLSKRHFKKILVSAGLPREVRLYDLRHTCATLLLSAHKSPKIVAERLGHSSVVLTLDTYSHVLPSMQKEASDELESMLFSKIA